MIVVGFLLIIMVEDLDEMDFLWGGCLGLEWGFNGFFNLVVGIKLNLILGELLVIFVGGNLLWLVLILLIIIVFIIDKFLLFIEMVYFCIKNIFNWYLICSF